MSGVLKQSTAVTVVVGPFLDSTDGITPETALTIPASEVLVSKAGAAFAAKSEASALTHMTHGFYSCALNATDTGTRGNFRVSVQEAGALPVWDRFIVYSADAFDCLYGPDNLFTMLETINAQIVTAQNDLNVLTGVDGATLASIQLNYVPATDADLDTLNTAVGVIDGIVDAILVDTGTTLDTKINTLTTNLATANTNVTAIKAKTDSLTFTNAGVVNAGIFRVNQKVIDGDGNATPFYALP